MSTTASSLPSVFSEDDARNHLDTVRDLLFGSRNREMDRRIATLEEKLTATLTELEARIMSQFENLGQSLRGEIGNTKEQFAAERTELEQKSLESGEVVKELGQTLHDRFSEMGASILRVESEGRLLVFERAKNLKDEIGNSLREVSERMEKQLADVRTAAAPRAELGHRLMDLGRLFVADVPETPAGR